MSEATYQGASPNALFLKGAMPASETSWQSWAQRAGGSVALHLAILVFMVYALTRIPAVQSVLQPETPNITWVAMEGPGGGGGGGGNRTPDPPKKAEFAPPKAKAPEPTKIEPPPKIEPPKMTVPAVTAVAELPGAVSAIPDPTPALGSGTGGGGGTGRGTGVGPGTGSGLGPGSGGGAGGGVYAPGNGVSVPVLVREVKPSYTGDAMRAKIQGLVTMEAVVMPDGSVGSVQITRSLDSHFGLDEEAIKTVKQWRFRPGLRDGQPVAVRIEIEMSFTLR